MYIKIIISDKTYDYLVLGTHLRKLYDFIQNELYIILQDLKQRQNRQTWDIVAVTEISTLKLIEKEEVEKPSKEDVKESP